jgi:hypothetical protein
MYTVKWDSYSQESNHPRNLIISFNQSLFVTLVIEGVIVYKTPAVIVAPGSPAEMLINGVVAEVGAMLD